MKNVFVILIVALFSTCAIAQTTGTIELGKAGKIAGREGTLIRKDFALIGNISSFPQNLKIYAATYIDLSTNEKQNAVNIMLTQSTRNGQVIIDIEEIDNILKMLDLLKAKVLRSKGDESTEVNYYSKTGFQINVFFDDEWKILVKPDRYNKDFYYKLDNEELGKFIGLLQQAKLKAK